MKVEKDVMSYIFAPKDIKSLSIADSNQRFAVNRIFCVGRNYLDHAKEMGIEKKPDQPIFFMKPLSALKVIHDESLLTVKIPAMTDDYHHEVELVVAIGKDAPCNGGVPIDKASELIFGYGCGLDMTRRDRQNEAKKNSHPWLLAKGADDSAILSSLVTKASVGSIDKKAIHLKKNQHTVQQSSFDFMIWSVEELISILSHYFNLQAGDVIMTGTPAGVGAVKPGDVLNASIADVGVINVQFE